MPTIKLKIRNNSNGWDLIYPETSLASIVDSTTAGRNLASLSPSVDGVVTMTTTGQASVTPLASIPGAIGAAPASHTHPYADISGLTGALANKADLSAGKILSTQLPDWIIGGLKYVNSISTATTIDDAFRTANGMDPTTGKGRYVICTGATISISWGAGYQVNGEEADTSSPIVLEQGDWLVYRGQDTNHIFDIVNNAYQTASTSAYGIGSLAVGVSTRAALASTSDATKIIDEAALRSVMKGIYYEDHDTTPIAPLPGDLLIEY